MDLEEPKAAAIIAIALNKKNEAAMHTGHLEIMRALAGLCVPDPSSGTGPFNPVRDEMIDRYGSAVDSEHFIDAFRACLHTGRAAAMARISRTCKNSRAFSSTRSSAKCLSRHTRMSLNTHWRFR